MISPLFYLSAGNTSITFNDSKGDKMDILKRYEIVKSIIPEIKKLWARETEQHKHLLSVSSSIANACDWNLEKIRDYCLSLGFNGAEIRFQGFKNPAGLELLRKDKDFLPTAHLSDFAHWLYSSEQIKNLMTESERVSYFGNKDHQKATEKCFLQELKLASQLDIDIVTFHAAQIEFLGLLGRSFLFSDEEVLERVKIFLLKLLPQANFKGKIGLENDGPYSRGMRLPKNFKALDNSINMPNVGFTLDIAHLASNSLDLKINHELSKKIWVVHLSEPILDSHLKISDELLSKTRSQGFIAFRKLAGQAISCSDAHNPVGEVITDAKMQLDKIYQANSTLVVVHELKVPLDIMKESCILQQAELLNLR